MEHLEEEAVIVLNMIFDKPINHLQIELVYCRL